MKNNRSLSVLAIALVVVFCCAAGPVPDVEQVTNRLATSILLGPSMKTLGELTDQFGGRLTGSPAYQRAAEWAAERFRSYGIQNVRLEAFTIANGWERGSAHGELLSPVRRSLHVESIGWGPSTPDGGIQAEVIQISDVAPEALKNSADKIKGRIVLLDTAKIYAEGYRKASGKLRKSYPVLKQEGALAVILPDRESNNVINAHSTGWHAELTPLPLAQLGMEDAKLIAGLLDNPGTPVKLDLELHNKTTGRTQVNNVIAEIRGSEHPEEWILIGAHLDSWDFGTGAQDNGTGTVMVLEAARAIASLGQAPRRSIRFALWGGEEEGLLGSYAYTQMHTSELDKCIAVLNTDNGAGHPKGWKVEGRQDLVSAMTPLSESLKELSGDHLSMDTTYDTDHGPFMLHGIPSLDLEVDMSHYMEVHHKSSDTLDKVDPLFLRADGAIVAVTAYQVAQAQKPLASHIDHAAVGEILKKAELDEILTDAGVWKP